MNNTSSTYTLHKRNGEAVVFQIQADCAESLEQLKLLVAKLREEEGRVWQPPAVGESAPFANLITRTQYVVEHVGEGYLHVRKLPNPKQNTVAQLKQMFQNALQGRKL